AAEIKPLPMTDGQPFANSKYFTYGGYKLHYRIDEAKGKEKAKMFMLHGFMCNTEFFNELVEDYTKAGIKCVRLDLPNFGYSVRESNDIKYVPQTEMILALMKELDPDGTGWILVGHSMGGSVALETAMQDASQLRAVILNAPMFMANFPKSIGKMLIKKPVLNAFDTMIKYIADYDILFKVMAFFMTFGPLYSLKMDANVMSGPFKMEHTGYGLCFMSYRASKPDTSNLAKQLADVPTQLVLGGLDMFVLPNVAANLSKALPADADRQRIWLGGHCFLQNYHKTTSKMGLKFLKDRGIL
ncbi:MAG: alpha/beta hydrolase, partial [Clostridia bacterium]|nr:alpha/beta hydrolase [Clostridia bacterium]